MSRMRKIRLEKVTINMGAGEAGQKLENAKKLVGKFSENKIVVTKTRRRTTFGVAKHRPIGAKVTLRGENAREFLEKVLHALDNRLRETNFDDNGNFSLGIKEYIHIPGVRYDPEIGIMGMDVCVTLERPGFRVRRRRVRPKSIGKKHRITREESQEWVKKEFGVMIVKEGEE
jgi:large subunit ribosomal protein L5